VCSARLRGSRRRAIAERAGLVVLHQDKGFDRIWETTGQPTERLGG
jgi:hypothetical protein